MSHILVHETLVVVSIGLAAGIDQSQVQRMMNNMHEAFLVV